MMFYFTKILFEVPGVVLVNSDSQEYANIVSDSELHILFMLGGFVCVLLLVAIIWYALDGRREPGIEIHWGGFGGGINGLTFRPHALLGFFALVGFISWIIIAYAVVTSKQTNVNLDEKKVSSQSISNKEIKKEIKNDKP